MEENNIDVIMSSSQKGLQAMPGITFIISKKDVIEKSKNNPKRSFYNNLYDEYKYFQKNKMSRFTPPIQIIFSMLQAVKEINKETIEKKYLRHQKLMALLKKELKLLNFNFLIKDEFQSGIILSVKYPEEK
jgi:2-aminoethylphosphonate-pyruvate transaminase